MPIHSDGSARHINTGKNILTPGGRPSEADANSARWDSEVQRTFYNGWKYGLKHQTVFPTIIDNSLGIKLISLELHHCGETIYLLTYFLEKQILMNACEMRETGLYSETVFTRTIATKSWGKYSILMLIRNCTNISQPLCVKSLKQDCKYIPYVAITHICSNLCAL